MLVEKLSTHATIYLFRCLSYDTAFLPWEFLAIWETLDGTGLQTYYHLDDISTGAITAEHVCVRAGHSFQGKCPCLP